MSKVSRATWGRDFAFSEPQRKELRKILKRQDPELVESYLNEIQVAIATVRFAWNTYGNVPPQSPADAKEVLRKIAKHAEALHGAIQELDLSTSEIPLAVVLGRLGRGFETIEYLNHDLPLIHICANQAAGDVPKGQRGRPADEIEQKFIGSLGSTYLKLFGRRPSKSRGTEFPRFIAAALAIALPGNPHAAVDNSKIVAKALKRAGVIR